MSETVAIAIISSLSALLGVCISQLFELKKRKSEEGRWYADYFLPKKFDAIADLYAQLRTTYGTTVYRNRKLKDDAEFQQLVVGEVNSFIHKYHVASIYLSKDVNQSLDNFRESITEAGLHIKSQIEPIIFRDKDGVEKNVVVEWPNELDAQYTAARDKLGKKLTPKFLKSLEKE